MPFRFLSLLDQILGTCLLLFVSPLCQLIARVLPPKKKDAPQTITILKLHGGGSLLIAMPALLGIRAQYPKATISLIGTPETKKYAELTGVFDHTTLINATSLAMLVITGIKALITCHRDDVVIDLEPHSALAAVFTPLTFAARRIGFVKAGESTRARSYTDALHFNLHAPIHVFYEQVATLLNALPALDDACRTALEAQSDATRPLVSADYPRPIIYASAFTSSLSPERMLPTDIWVRQLQMKFGDTPFTLILGGGAEEAEMARTFATRVTATLPATKIIIACGSRSLRQAVADIDASDEFWGVDSGPLHIARLLGKKCTSFWGPSNPTYRLRAIPGLEENVFYRAFPCSPCVHMSNTPPCKGDNQCMKQLFAPDVPPPIWRA